MLQKNRNRMPDVLDCLANFSNDEVFTPPKVVNEMLDMLPQEIFRSKETTFLDPCAKTGVFLREITKRLLANQVPDYERTYKEIERITKEAIQDAVRTGKLDLNDPDYEKKAQKTGDDAIKAHPDANRYLAFEVDLQAALDHILTKQVFGIAITELTADLDRRSLYCSKDASGRFSITGTAFGINKDGNIRFVPQKHTWKNGTCIYCGASRTNFDRPDELESHAYEFIHTDTPEEILMGLQFTVICGNPPYQLNTAVSGGQAIPIYNRFVEQAKRLNPRYLTMIIPSRWLAGGIGLDKFRTDMMNDTHISYFVDFENAQLVFPGVHIDSGVCYFLRDSAHDGKLHYVLNTHNGDVVESDRYLKCSLSNVVIRDVRQISILEKVMSENFIPFSNIVSTMMPYGFDKGLFNNPQNYEAARLHDSAFSDAYHIYGVKGIKGGAKRTEGYVAKASVKNIVEADRYKLFFTTSYSSNAVIPPETIVGEPGDICTGTFLNIGGFDSKDTRDNCNDYIHTTFFRALLYFRRGSMQVTKSVFDYIPLQDFSKPWTDAELYEKYNLTQDEIDFIESMIKPME